MDMRRQDPDGMPSAPEAVSMLASPVVSCSRLRYVIHWPSVWMGVFVLGVCVGLGLRVVASHAARRTARGGLPLVGAVARRVDHVGSTAVPGLAAKPIVDIDLSVPDVDDEPSYLPALERAGYLLRVREPGHRLVRTAERDVHVHVCPAGSDWERRHLLFRDRLRADRRDRAAYAALKLDLAGREWADMNAYADAKGPLIADITRRAEGWAQRVGWTVDR